MKNTSTKINVSNSIKPTPVFTGVAGQDGAIYDDFLFRFETNGNCTVYSLSKREQIARFTLDKVDIIKPHSNTVCFTSEYFAATDEFPLLYCNVYNNYAKEEDRREGMCCVYRIMRDGENFTSALVQIIRIGFVEDLNLWKSLPEGGDNRPYGNFVPDVTNGRLYAYVMRDEPHTTRFFEFLMPCLSQGTYDEKYGVKVLTLNVSDIKAQFDCEYFNIIQGGCAYNGLLYSVEGGTVKDGVCKNWPRLRVVDTVKHELVASVDLHTFGLSFEPELIDFAGDTLYFMDCKGNVYTLEFC
ncbi:MAG: hypothetical protein IJ428_05605 [Clostridia bacterium]|nr:hypothetical protein [Clostridia bacterium]